MVEFLINVSILAGLLALALFMCGIVVFVVLFWIHAIKDCLEGNG